MSDYHSRIVEAIQTLKLASEMSLKYYHKPLIICYSGGKDSDVLLDIAKSADIPFEVQNSHTTVDAPETVYHIRKVFSQFGKKERITLENGQKVDVYGNKARIIYPLKTMWELIEERTVPPTRIMRYCCSVLKESSTPNRIAVTGVRKDESHKRARRKAFEKRGGYKGNRVGRMLDDMRENYQESVNLESVLDEDENQVNAYDCQIIVSAKKKRDLIVNAIINLTEDDIWRYIKENDIEVCELYYKGYRRVGCIGCPMGSYKARMREYSEYPTYKRAYMRALDKAIKNRKAKGLECKRETAKDLFDWWIENPNIKGQISLNEYAEREQIQTVSY